MKRFRDCPSSELRAFLGHIGQELHVVENGQPIPGSFWKGSEAGLIANKLFVRSDTPLHSILHESGHYICMTGKRRQTLDTNAIGDSKGDYKEEDAVCYLQALLADKLTFYSRTELFSDMDEWGYSFRLGSAQGWFESDSDDAREWLIRHELIDTDLNYDFNLRA